MQPENLVYSDFTAQEMYRAGAGRGAIDPCFPSKIGIPHVYNLIFQKHAKKPLDAIFFPMIDTLHQPLKNCSGSNACPTVTATPNAVKAAFTKESDVFKENGIQYLDPILNIDDPKLFGLQMFQTWAPILGLSEEENERAIEVAYKAFEDFDRSMRKRAREVLDTLERENRLGIVMLGRVYHHDPGLNHEIMEEFQKLGYPVFSQSLLPMDEDLLERLFGDEVRSGAITHALDIRDVWKNAYSGSTNHEDLGGEVHRAASQPGGARDQQLQVRTRRADLQRDRRHHRELGHAVLLVQGPRREQADRLDQDSRRDDRLLPEALSRRPAEESGCRQGTRAPAGRVRALVAYGVDAEIARA